MSRKPLMLPFLKFHRKNRKKAPTKKAPRKKWVLHRYKRRWKIERFFAWLNRFKKAITRWEHCAEQYYHPCLSCFFYDFALPYYNKWIPIMKWVLIKYPIMESSSEKNWEKVYILVYYKNKTTIYSDRAFPWSPKEQSIKGLSHRVRQRKN